MTTSGPRALRTRFSPVPRQVPAIRPTAAPAPALSDARPEVRGKFLFADGKKLLLRGMTYGTVAPAADGDPYPPDEGLRRDFAAMTAAGINVVRTYTPPPARVLRAAREHGLRILAGLTWEAHVAFLDGGGRAGAIVARVRQDVRRIAGHPALLGFAIGDEIPAGVVRWHGARRIERFLARLARAVRAEDPGALVTYVNCPATESLNLPFLDFVCFNVALERQRDLRDYVAHLHQVAGDRPLVLAEVGLDSLRKGAEDQSRAIEWQLRTAFAGGAAGAFVFPCPRPALRAAALAFAEAPYPPVVRWPRVSVVVCSRNGSRTVRDCFDALLLLDYPDFEVLVVDDGPTGRTGDVGMEYGFRVIRTGGGGQSAARNEGLRAASGEIVAYIDDDTFPDPDWLTYLAGTFMSTPHAAVGGPSVTPGEDGWLARGVANAPGGNMAFRRDALNAIEGFDPVFRTAGNDVDVRWRLQDAGHTLGFSPGALVWRHRHGSLRAFWRRQVGFGRAEALLEEKWPRRHHRRVPEWYLVMTALAALGMIGVLWTPLLWALPLVGLGVALPMARAALVGARVYPHGARSRARRFAMRVTAAALHAIQPLARLHGRLLAGRTPWRRRPAVAFGVPARQTLHLWSEPGRDPAAWPAVLERALRDLGAVVRPGATRDGWDLEVSYGTFGGARLVTVVEEHGSDRQLVRVRVWPRASRAALTGVAVTGALATLAALDGAGSAGGVLLSLATGGLLAILHDVAAAVGAARRALHALRGRTAETRS